MWQLWNNRNFIIWKGRGVLTVSLVQAGMFFLESLDMISEFEHEISS